MGSLLLLNAILLLAYMTLSFGVAYARKRVDTVDVAWGLGFLVSAWLVAADHYSDRSRVIVTLVTIWGVRLATHIYLRSRHRGDDARYGEITKNWKGNFWLRAYFSVFLLQVFLTWLISLPIVFASNPVIVADTNSYLAAGIIIWLVGFFTETIADAQLSRFLELKDRPKVMQTGLWRYSRHPNYFGELTQWWAIGIIALQASFGWVGLLGPLTLTILIVFVSGIPPIEKRRAKDAAYRDYQRKTSAILPLPPKKI